MHYTDVKIRPFLVTQYLGHDIWDCYTIALTNYK